MANTATGEAAPTWEVRTEAGTVLLDLGAHAYLTATKTGKGFTGELLVLAGSAEVLSRSGSPLGTIPESYRAVFSADNDVCRSEPQDAFRVPAWRLDLVSEGELARLLGAKVRVLGRKDGALEAELTYRGQNQQRALADWICELMPAGPASAPRDRSSGFALPAGTRLRHTVPFGAPLAIELKLARESQGETSFAFGVLESADGGVAVDVAREAALQIRDKGRTVRGAALPARAPSGKLEGLRLEITREDGGLT
ncbi:MAG: hypothetical protein NTW87_31420, partial [Planctomycetota bacterium]|nr:hypothetical protein [Planctomycetota bacterium]